MLHFKLQTTCSMKYINEGQIEFVIVQSNIFV